MVSRATPTARRSRTDEERIMTAPIVLIANTAGGTGKTTSAHAIAVASVEYGKSVLVVDADPSATLTFLAGIENPRTTVAELLQGSFTIESAVIKSAERFSLIPSASRAFGHEGEWNWLEEARTKFDLVIIDSPTGPSPALRDIASYATMTVIPILDSFLALRGALHVADFLRSAQSPSKIALMPIRCDGIKGEYRSMISDPLTILEPAIRFDNAIVEAETSMRSVLTLAPNSQAASDYREVTYSILESVGLF